MKCLHQGQFYSILIKVRIYTIKRSENAIKVWFAAWRNAKEIADTQIETFPVRMGLYHFATAKSQKPIKNDWFPAKRSRPVLVFPENGFQIESRKKKVES